MIQNTLRGKMNSSIKWTKMSESIDDEMTIHFTLENLKLKEFIHPIKCIIRVKMYNSEY